MTDFEKIKAAVDAEKDGNVFALGQLVLMLAESSPRAAAVIAQDLGNPEMSLGKCFAALKAHARAHQKGGFWGCIAPSYADKDNDVVKLVLDFYKIPPEWLTGAPVPAPEPEKPKRLGGKIDLLDLL